MLADAATVEAIRNVIEAVDKGRLRTAEPVDVGHSEWRVNEWVKKAVILYFPISKMRTMRGGELEWYDKMELKHGYEELGVRAVPHSVARYGAYIAPGAVLMPSYVNIGAYVDTGTMVDTWATVGSCAQIGKHVHLSGGVGIGGVLEPVQAAPVIIEDNVFIGGNCGIYEGTIVKENAVIGTGVIINSSTAIFDATTGEFIKADENGQMVVPEGAVVVAGSRPVSKGPGVEKGIHLYTPVIVKYRDSKTDSSVTLESVLRD